MSSGCNLVFSAMRNETSWRRLVRTIIQNWASTRIEFGIVRLGCIRLKSFDMSL